jgi:hypothetical protein
VLQQLTVSDPANRRKHNGLERFLWEFSLCFLYIDSTAEAAGIFSLQHYAVAAFAAGFGAVSPVFCSGIREIQWACKESLVLIFIEFYEKK